MDSSCPSFEECRRSAIRLGDQYRGLGIAVGLLGIAIILLALVPALSISAGVEQALGAVKVVLMILTLGLLIYGTRAGWHANWVRMRALAEKHRYAPLRSRIAEFEAASDVASDDARKALVEEIISISLGQVKYNSDKADDYGRMHRFSKLLGWLGFGLALAAAVVHLFVHSHVLLLFTVFVPALVGGIYGINHFLRIGDLADEHARMARFLGAANHALQEEHLIDRTTLITLSRSVLSHLEDDAAEWMLAASKIELSVG